MIKILAPAKLNLGLEILGRRPDGYHDLRTIFCAVSLFDLVTVERAERSTVNCDHADSIGENLATCALERARQIRPSLPHARVSIKKRIPASAGLGGASSDAAATLVGLNQISGNTISTEQLADLALACGSDVPFFLQSGLALGRGRGEELTTLPIQSPLHAVIITPRIAIPDKTRTMYSLVRPGTWTSGETTEALAMRLASGGWAQNNEKLPNAFRQPLYDLFPNVRMLADNIAAEIGRAVQVSGAGPSLFVLCSDLPDARSVRRKLGASIGPTEASIHRVRSVSSLVISEGPDV